MEKKYFTLEEANHLIPFLTDRLTKIKLIKNEIVMIVEDLETDEINLAELFKKREVTQKESKYRNLLETLGDQINDHIFEIQTKGPILKDIELGLIDFYTKIDGKDAYLCWKLGEEEVSFWHDLQSGFSGRESLFKREILESITKLH